MYTPISEHRAFTAALDALASGDEDFALENLVCAWRVSKAPSIANLVQALSRRLER